MSFRGHVLGAFAAQEAFSGSSEWVPEPPDQAKFCASVRPSVRNVFFFESFLDQENGILVEETRKSMSKKVILRW